MHQVLQIASLAMRICKDLLYQHRVLVLLAILKIVASFASHAVINAPLASQALQIASPAIPIESQRPPAHAYPNIMMMEQLQHASDASILAAHARH